MAISINFRTLCQQALDLAQAEPDTSRHIRVTKEMYDAMRVNGAEFVKNTPNFGKNNMTQTISYKGRTFFTLVPLE